MVIWERQTACMGYIRTRQTVLVQKPEERGNIEDLEIVE
jgi:hypothetical protein